MRSCHRVARSPWNEFGVIARDSQDIITLVHILEFSLLVVNLHMVEHGDICRA